MEHSEKINPELYRIARKRVRRLRRFYYTVACYVFVIGILAIINLRDTPDEIWFIFPAIGWGIGMLFYAMSVFQYNPFLPRGWEERKIAEILEKEKTKQQKQ
ncbi:MAG: 2TM domain-containing protein [Flavobacterium sp.]|nr:MAG: 2TM domain-containing protein [Flavobacterium sp.]